MGVVAGVILTTASDWQWSPRVESGRWKQDQHSGGF